MLSFISTHLILFIVQCLVCMRIIVSNSDVHDWRSWPTDTCSIQKLISEFDIEKQFKNINFESLKPTNVPGAVLTAWDESVENWDCQIASHKRFADRFGYSYYIYNDTSYTLENEGEDSTLPPHWVKVKALLWALEKEPKHPWVLYLDTDSIVDDSKKQQSRNVENFLRTVPNEEEIHLILPDRNDKWNTDLIFVKNTPLGIRLIENLWDLRKFCPSCHGEQCAAHLMLLEMLLYGLQLRLNENKKRGISDTVSDVVQIPHRLNKFNCCNPRSHCEFPHGRKKRAHDNLLEWHGPQVEGCVWHWEHALNFTNDDGRARRYPFVSGEFDFREYLGINHCSNEKIREFLRYPNCATKEKKYCEVLVEMFRQND